MNSATIQALEALGAAAAGAALGSVGDALVAGQTDWRIILGAALIAAAAKLVPNQIIKSATPAPAA